MIIKNVLNKRFHDNKNTNVTTRTFLKKYNVLATMFDELFFK